jgi:hypothetical protein
MRVNGGFFVFRPSSSEWMETERSSSRSRSSGWRRRQAALLQLRRLLGLHGHLQGKAAPRGPLLPRQVPWEVWKTRPDARPQERLTMQRLSLSGGRAGDADPRARAPTPTTSRSAAVARCSACSQSGATSRSPGWSSAPRPSGAEAEASAEQFLEGAARAGIVISPTGRLPPTRWAAVKEEFEELKRRSPRSDPHPLPRGPAPGPPVGLRADLEHLAQPLDLEFEIPKYDGDFGSPNLFVPSPRHTLERKIDARARGLPHPGGQGLVHRRPVPRRGTIRGWSAQAPERLAEAFYGRKLVV